MSINSSNEKSSFFDVLKSPYYGMVYLGLANAAYTNEGGSKEEIYNDFQILFNKDIQKQYLPQLPDFEQNGVKNPKTIDGSWSLDWGPAITEFNSNLIYIASYRDSQNTPLFYAVVVRGTDVAKGENWIGIIKQIIEDVDDFNLKSWHNILHDKFSDKKFNVTQTKKSSLDDQTGKISPGSKYGFLKIAESRAKFLMSDKKEKLTLAEALNSLLSRDNAPVVVTGHSLGANQTQVVAAYLDWQFGDKTDIIPQPIAPPTPGDKDFASMKVFANGQFWYNTLDLVPYAFITMEDNMSGLKWANKNLWTSYYWPKTKKEGPPLPKAIRSAIGVFGRWVPNSFYRPIGGMIKLEGSLPHVDRLHKQMSSHNQEITKESESVAMLKWQHFPPCYRELMWSQKQNEIVHYDYQSYHPKK